MGIFGNLVTVKIKVKETLNEMNKNIIDSSKTLTQNIYKEFYENRLN